jgi:hypothetical protein
LKPSRKLSRPWPKKPLRKLRLVEGRATAANVRPPQLAASFIFSINRDARDHALRLGGSGRGKMSPPRFRWWRDCTTGFSFHSHRATWNG